MKLSKSTAILALIILGAGAARAEVTANIGWVSDYIFRGVFQSDSSAFGGLDYEENGFYAGVWAADVDLGAEYDLYLGYGGEIEEFSYGIGATGYFYTDDFDDTYRELNLSAGYSYFSAEVALGEYDNFGGPTLDYTYYAVAVEFEGFYGKFADWSNDFAGEYFEVGFGTTVAEELDLSLSIIRSSEELAGGDEDTSIVFGITKYFTIAD